MKIRLHLVAILLAPLFACNAHAAPKMSDQMSGRTGSNFSQSSNGGSSATSKQGQAQNSKSGQNVKPLIPKHTSSKKR